MNEQSLKSANDFLSVAATTVAPGEFFDRPPTEIGKDAGIPNPLAVARAIRALAARRRVEMVDGRYRLLDATPLSPGEPESVPRTPRKRKARRRTGGPSVTRTEPASASSDRRPTYADLGRAVVDRLIEMGRETGEALGLADNLRREVKENRAARIDAEQRANRHFERVKELEHKLEMAEANLRSVLAAARGRGATAAPPDNEMEAVLRVLKGTPGRDGPADAEAGTDGEVIPVEAIELIAADGVSIDGGNGGNAGNGSGDGSVVAEIAAAEPAEDAPDAGVETNAPDGPIAAAEQIQVLEAAQDGDAHEAFGE
jgi:hypothetical protein